MADKAREFMGHLFPSSLSLFAPAAMRPRHWLACGAILILAICARFALLDKIPPGLWYDEALYSLDGYGVSQGHFAIFFDAHGHPREPLFPWLLGLAFFLFDPTVLVARCVSAFCGTLAVVIMFPVARRFLPTSWALAATAAFAVFRWHIHFSRTIFRAGLASLMILAVVWLFLRWRERRRSIDAALCGVAVGACLYTYISLRIAPALVTVWIGWLAWRGALNLRREWKQIVTLYGAALIVFAPLGIDYVQNPEHLFGRIDEISMFEKTVTKQLPDGSAQEIRVSKDFPEALAGLGENALAVAKAWFIKGDHVPRHNIPYRPVFDPATGFFFALGLMICGWSLVRRASPASLILLTWFGGFAMASVLSFGAPNILRMQGASPVVILIMVLGLRQMTIAWPKGRAEMARRGLPICVLIVFGATQLNDYFRIFPRDIEVRNAFGADVFYAPAKAVDAIATKVDTVYVPEELMDALQVKFVTIRRDNVVAYGPEDRLPIRGPGSGLADGDSVAWLMTVRSTQLAEQAGNEQAEHLRNVPGGTLVEKFMIPQKDDRFGRPVIRYLPWGELWVLPI